MPRKSTVRDLYRSVQKELKGRWGSVHLGIQKGVEIEDAER